MTLTCGGRGPCCHVGFPHRHCEHCDVVIPTQVQPHVHWSSVWNQPQYGTFQQLQALQAPQDTIIRAGLTDYLSNGEQGR